MKVLTIAGVTLRRMVRDPLSLFFVFVFPLLLVLVIGATFGGGFQPRIGIVEGNGPTADALAARLRTLDGFTPRTVGSASEAADGVSRGAYEAAIVIPDDGGSMLAVQVVVRQGSSARQIRTVIEGAVAAEAAVLRAADVLVAEGLRPNLREALETVDQVEQLVPGFSVVERSVDDSPNDRPIGTFDLGAAQQLVLFTFLTSLSGGAALIQARQWGVSRRMLATPTSARTVIAGEALGRFGVAIVQALTIATGSSLLFGVYWGPLLPATMIIALFAAVSAGASMLLGSLVDNDQQAGSLGVFLGLAAAALGGAMVPPEIFSPTMRNISHLLPHAWALDAFTEIVRRGGGVSDILIELGMLSLFAVVILVAAATAFRKTLTTS